jgi:hypothetical protein
MTKLLIPNDMYGVTEKNGVPVVGSDIKDLPSESNDGGYVYIVDLGNRIKIGKSKNVKRRFKEIQQLSGKHIVRFCISPECGNYHEIENSLHKKFRHLSIFGEWFNLEFEKSVSELSEYSFSAPKHNIYHTNDFNIEAFAKHHLENVLEENPIIKKYLDEHGLSISYCKTTNEILISDEDGNESEFKAFMRIFVSMQASGFRISNSAKSC